MPELPEVEVLVRHLRPLLRGRRVRLVEVLRSKIVAPSSPKRFGETLNGAVFEGLERRGKFLLFSLKGRDRGERIQLVGHLGMTGRMYLQESKEPLPRHAAVVLGFGRQRFVFEDTRYFGRLTLDTSSVEQLGPEPWSAEFTVGRFGRDLARSAQSIKVRLLDQRLVAGIGNIYASEALFRAGVRPTVAARRLRPQQVQRLWEAIRSLLSEAIEWGSTVRLNFAGRGKSDRLFYFGRTPGNSEYNHERLQVYDRAGQACVQCGTVIRRLVQGGRSTYFCPACQSPAGRD
jgi:formamidopyrimidine-DNA glycosylase